MKMEFPSSFREKFFSYTFDETNIPVSPLMLAVTGHRNIEPTASDSIREKAEKWFLRIGRNWQTKQGFRSGETSCAPILVLDGMAVGADTLVAEVVLKIKKEHPDLNFQLIAVLPMPKKLYENDFSQKSELDTFQRLCDAADCVLELPCVCGNESDSMLSEEERIAQYEQLGKYLVSNSMFLLALWDGDCGVNGIPKAGGTADVVRMKLNGVVSDSVIPIELESLTSKSGLGVIEPSGVVFHIVTPRESRVMTGSQKAGDLYCYFPDENDYRHPAERKIPKGKHIQYNQIFSLRHISHPFEESAEMNKDALRNYRKWNELKSNSQKWLLGENPPLDAELQFMTEHYTMLDSLALLYQKKFFRYAVVYIAALLLFSLTFYLECYCRPLSQGIFSSKSAFSFINYLDIPYYLVFLMLIVLFWRVAKAALYEKYHRYRALAEILRIQIFWYLAAIPEKSYEHYWGHQINNMNWLRITAKTLLFTIHDNNVPHFDFVKEHWLLDQYKYFTGKTPGYKKTDKRLELYSKFFLVFAFLWFAGRIFVNREAFQLNESCCSNMEIWLYYIGVQLIAMSGMFAVCCMLWNRLKANNSLVKRYKKMVPIYSQVLYAFAKINDSDVSECQKDLDRKKLLRYMGEYALMENADWFLMTRKLELPK